MGVIVFKAIPLLITLSLYNTYYSIADKCSFENKNNRHLISRRLGDDKLNADASRI